MQNSETFYIIRHYTWYRFDAMPKLAKCNFLRSSVRIRQKSIFLWQGSAEPSDECMRWMIRRLQKLSVTWSVIQSLHVSHVEWFSQFNQCRMPFLPKRVCGDTLVWEIYFQFFPRVFWLLRIRQCRLSVYCLFSLVAIIIYIIVAYGSPLMQSLSESKQT